MTSLQRVAASVAHNEPDRVPVDLGSTSVTGMHVSVVYSLRQALRLDSPGTPVRVINPYQMLGEIASDLADSLGVDTVGMLGPRTSFGFANADWKQWTLNDGTPVLVPGGFNTDYEPDGSLFLFPKGDRTARPSGLMPKGGYYFDAIIRQEPIDEDHLNFEDNVEEFGQISEDDLEHYAREIDRVSKTGKAVMGNFGGTGFGDIALVPGLGLRDPKGIRDVEEWYISTSIRPDYIKAVFAQQCEIGIGNLRRLHEVVGNRVFAVLLTGTDFGTQRGPFISRDCYRDLFAPFHRRVTDWVHEHTEWKCMMHSCGSIVPLIPDFIDAGFDILNPVQCSAAGMEPAGLKRDFGDRIVFWGGGVDTQHTLPFGTPEEVRAQVTGRLRAFSPGGGFVFNTIHNIQAMTPVANIVAMVRAVRDFNGAGA